MSSRDILFIVMLFGLFALAFSCQNVNFKLRKNSTMRQETFCSSETQDISSPRKKAYLLSREGAIGIYMKSNFSGQICYWHAVENGLIPLGSLTGGTFYAIGKLESFVNQQWANMCYSFYLLFTDHPAGWHPASWEDVL